jgi:FMN phosphatase YigB (HAD superfamily)
MSAIRAVVFDVGETLLDETRIWTEHADRLQHVCVESPRTPLGGRRRLPVA